MSKQNINNEEIFKPFNLERVKKLNPEDPSIINKPSPEEEGDGDGEEKKKEEKRFVALYEAPPKEIKPEDNFVSLYSRDEPLKKKHSEEKTKPEQSKALGKQKFNEPPKAAEPKPLPIDPKEVERKAYESGFTKGEREGFAKGEKEGFIKGEREGFAKGEKEGFIKGEKDAFNSGQVKSLDLVKRLEGILSDINVLWTNLISTNEKQIIQLVLKVAEKVILGSAAVDHEIVRRSILHAFEAIPEPIDVTINVNPDDYEYIEAVKNSFFEKIKDLKYVSVISDPSVTIGGAKIETSGGKVDTTIESRLEAVKKSIIGSSKLTA